MIPAIRLNRLIDWLLAALVAEVAFAGIAIARARG
jgi:hypothetical protein